MRVSAVKEHHEKIIKKFYLEPDGIQIIRDLTGLSYKTITSYALKRLGLKRRGVLKRSPIQKNNGIR